MSSRRSFVFKSLFTQEARPTTKRRRLTYQPGDTTQPGDEDWAGQCARIEELHGNHTVSEIKDIMAQEGLVAEWNLTKYLELSEEQWDYIKAKLVERAQQGKRTSFRYKNGVKIPSAKIKRTVERRWPWALERWTENVSSKNSSISSKGISAYTGSTIRVLIIKTRENVTRFSINSASPQTTESVSAPAPPPSRIPAIETALAKLNGQHISLADIVSPSLQALAEEFERDLEDNLTSSGIQFVFQRYSYLAPSSSKSSAPISNSTKELNFFNFGPHHSATDKLSPEHISKSVEARLKVLQKSYPRSVIRVSRCGEYLDCHICKMLNQFKLDFSDLAWSFADFEFDHLSSPEHRFRVSKSVLK